MKRAIALSVLSVAVALAAAPAAQAQDDYGYGNGRSRPLTLNVRPQSWLRLGNVVSPGASVNPASALGQTISYLNSPPYANLRDRYEANRLPDPVTNGPFVGATNPFGPVDYGAPFYFE